MSYNRDILLSIIMPVYNGASYLKIAIQSILTQTFSNFELIIIDDGSTDESLAITQSFNDNRIKIIKNETNKGLVFSLNKGLNLAQGKYIGRMDADDISMPSRLEKQFTFLEQNPTYCMVGCSADIIDNTGKITSAWQVKTTIETINMELLFGSPFIHPSILIRNDVLREFGYNTMFYPAEDYYLWFQILQKYKAANLPEKLLQYRLHNSNISTTFQAQQAAKCQDIYQLYLRQLNINFSSKEFKLHTKIAYHANTLKISKSDLIGIEGWLLKLRQHSLFQNHNYINKKWIQICLQSNLGLFAFRYFLFSSLNNSISIRQKVRLLIASLLISLLGKRKFHLLKNYLR